MPLTALISVYDKTGVVEFARALAAAGVRLISTGKTHSELSRAGLEVRQVADVTGAPEILDGRVKTLHPRVHGGLLARRDVPSHMAELSQHGIQAIDIVVNNLYPFSQTIAKPGISIQDALEQIDIGGPAMIRAAAKNFPFVTVVVDPADYPAVAAMIASGGVPDEERKRLAARAFQHVALYDTVIAGYLRDSAVDDAGALFPSELTAGYTLAQKLRYGENPHQVGALYASPGTAGVASAAQLHGKEMSYNNFLDADAALGAVSRFDEQAVAIIKHSNPCGLAAHDDQAEAYRRAFAGDPVSAYGGIVAFNRPITAETADAMKGVFYEVVIAPEFAPAALDALLKRKNIRVLKSPVPSRPARVIRQISGGALVQTPDLITEDPSKWDVVTRRKPTADEIADMAFAWRACVAVKSNAIVLARDRAVIGMGAGQPNRVNSVHIAIKTAGDRARGTVLASDAFFPFADGLELAAEAGIQAVVQPGGSIRDEEIITAADRHGLAMAFTGTRHFNH
jgi:phosphoribosylaminoimidazolecarboxamide formyltransferase/IMP cyclohydrolase